MERAIHLEIRSCYGTHVIVSSYYSVRTIRPEKCEFFAQRYQSRAINAKCQTRYWYFLNLLKPCQNIFLSQFLLLKMLYAIKAVWFERKRCRPRSDCSLRSSLIRVYTFCHFGQPTALKQFNFYGFSYRCHNIWFYHDREMCDHINVVFIKPRNWIQQIFGFLQYFTSGVIGWMLMYQYFVIVFVHFLIFFSLFWRNVEIARFPNLISNKNVYCPMIM